MATVETAIDIQMPVRSVYNQWTQFEDFPKFLQGVESVTQMGPERLHWRAQVAGVRREWDAQIVRQEPDRVISWASLDGAQNAGTVMFDDLEPALTRVTLRMDFDPEGFVEKAGDTLGIWQRRVEGDLERFKEFLEERGSETGAWRGEIEQGRTVTLEEKRPAEVTPGTERSSFPTQGGGTRQGSGIRGDM